MARNISKEDLMNQGYVSMGVDEEGLEFMISKHPEGGSIRYHIFRSNKLVWGYPKVIDLGDIVLYNKMKELLEI